MKPLDFFHTEAVVQALDRAARCAAVPLRLHYVDQGEEGPKIMSIGQCAACRYVASLPEGNQACRASRLAGATAALGRGKATAFVCHMGFGCVAIPALPDAEERFVLTLGPYCPAEEPRALEKDAVRGLENLGVTPGAAFPVSLSDVRVVPAAAVPEIAGWTAEVLADLWQAAQEHVEAPQVEPETGGGAGRIRRRPPYPTPDPYHAGDIAAALLGGNQAQARALVRAALAESRSGRRAKIAVRRARAVAMVSAVLEGAERAEVDISQCWGGFSDFVAQVKRARTDEQLAAAAMRLLGAIKRKAQRVATSAHSFVELNRLVMSRLPGKITLNEIAAELGQHPTAITHRLQRKFGMSFSEYVGRIRIDKAKELLRRTRLGAGEIARRVGTSDASNFSKLFRKLEGMSPLEYRKLFGGKQCG